MGIIKSIVQIIILLIILCIVFIFVYSNIGQDVQIFFDLQYFGLGRWGTNMMPLPLALFIAFIAGIVSISVITIYEMFKGYFKVSSLKKEIKRLRKELATLRNYPLEESYEGEEEIGERFEKEDEGEIPEESIKERLKGEGLDEH